MAESTNYGIIGNVTATNVAVGSQPRINVPDAAELSARVAELERAVAAHEGPGEARAELGAAVREVAEELRAPAPDKGKLASRLALIGSVSGATSAVTGAATGLMSVIEHVL